MQLLYYEDWYKKRLDKILSIFGTDWFAGKKILELGACHGSIGIELLKLGASVVFADYRQEHLDVIQSKLHNFPVNYKLQLLDQETKWNLDTRFDLVLHLGVLYHIENWKQDLKCALQHTNTLILETLVHSALLPDRIQTTKSEQFFEPYQGKTKNKISMFCQESVEKTLENLECKFIRFDNQILNSNICWERGSSLVQHIYDWDYDNKYTKFSKGGHNIAIHHRRFWLVVK